MHLNNMSYSQFEGQPEEWYFKEFEPGQINLLVSKNAIGKSRVLNVIYGLCGLISNTIDRKINNGDWKAVFKNDSDTYKYNLSIKDSVIIKEELLINDESKLSRREDGFGHIYANKLGSFYEFQIQNDKLAIVTQRNKIQNDYLTPLVEWCEKVIKYNFSTSLGRDVIAVFGKHANPSIDFRDTGKAVGVFIRGKKDYGEKYLNVICKDMEDIGYHIEDIDFRKPAAVTFEESAQGELYVLSVKEKELNCRTEQIEASQGMFRALSVLIHLNYLLMGNKPSCILIDDIGEGLDYDRSSRFIRKMIEKVGDSNIQLIMTTNDRFVMNNIPLEMWIVIKRDKNILKFYSSKNSKKVFDEFRFTGLNNFDFFVNEYYSGS